jgi:hypothetical protein
MAWGLVPHKAFVFLRPERFAYFTHNASSKGYIIIQTIIKSNLRYKASFLLHSIAYRLLYYLELFTF